ncbi:hypothetical protein AX282_05920 [Bacillus spizizenii]|uniref:pyocin knob domain-containing protein n=1 Tax=Bacillus spizizenii TaxID=96241 RepID=UPI0007725498|nr:pyocin knob domain-containing protein [Bacillus spizizenii]KXJ35258.1 hypothetical protein AX282_05920 [Bacillus spizizenii]
MSSSKFVGQLKQNNEQINNLKALLSQNEKRMTDHEQELTDKVNDFMEYQNYELIKHMKDIGNPHQVTKQQVGLSNLTNDKQATKIEFDTHVKDTKIHVTDSERTKWNAAQLSKLTQDNGLTKYLSEVDFNSVIESGFYYITSVSTSLNAPVNSNGYLLVYNYGTYPYQEFTAYSGATTTIPETRRKFMRNKVSGAENWTPWMEIEYSAGAQAKVNAHANKTDIHVTKEDKDKWNGAQLSKLTQDNGKVFYKNNSETTDYNEITDTGMYLIYNTGLNGPGLTQCFLLVMSYGNTLVQTAYDATNGLKSLYRIRKYDSVTWSKWIEFVPTQATWQSVTLKNGAATGDRPFQYARWGSLLLLRGHIKATREVVCGTIPSDGLPANGAAKMVPVSGTTGYSKLFINASGDMKLTGIHSNDDSNVTGYYMDAVIPLE